MIVVHFPSPLIPTQVQGEGALPLVQLKSTLSFAVGKRENKSHIFHYNLLHSWLTTA